MGVGKKPVGGGGLGPLGEIPQLQPAGRPPEAKREGPGACSTLGTCPTRPRGLGIPAAVPAPSPGGVAETTDVM